MNNAVNFNHISANDVEHEERFNKKNTISVICKLLIFRNAAQEWICRQPADALIEFLCKCRCSRRAVKGNPIVDGEQVIHRNRKVTDGAFT